MRWGIVGLALLAIGTAGYVAPQFVNRLIQKVDAGLPLIPESPFKLGLDLRGGAHLIYEADTTNILEQDRAASVEGVRDVIERRVNALGIGEPNVQTAKYGETYRILIELPGVTDIAAAIAMIGETPTLEFKEENTDPPRTLTTEEEKELKEDNADAKKRANAILKRLKAGESFETVAKELSEDPLSKNNGGYLGFVSQKNTDELIFSWAQKAKEGEISPVIETEEGFEIVRRGTEQEGEKKITARHILICYQGAKSCTSTLSKEDVLKEAERLYGEATAANFAELAKKHSTEPGASESGGLLPVFGRGEMVKPFEDAAFGAAVGTIIGPVETPFGYHIIFKQKEDVEKTVELSRILIVKRTAADIVPPQEPWKSTGLSGTQLKRAEVVTDTITGAVQVSLQFNEEGTTLFRTLTERHVGEPIAIFLDGQPISIPIVQQPILSGEAVISGNFGLTEARLLAQRLNAGALPVPITLASEQTVGPTLGADALQKSMRAGFLGMILVTLFMIIFYRIPGVISAIALTLYVAITLAVFKAFGITLTLAGIAGFILSIGMAVDANVLIFERMKEELKEKKSLRIAIEDGFLRAWSAIRDGNVSTLITCAILVILGSGFVKGFAIALSIGILVSMFTAIVVTRTVLRFIVPWFRTEKSLVFLNGGSRTSSL